MPRSGHVLDLIVGQLKEKEEEPEGEVLGDTDTGSLTYIYIYSSFDSPYYYGGDGQQQHILIISSHPGNLEINFHKPEVRDGCTPCSL